MKLGNITNPIQPASLLQNAAAKLQQTAKIGNLAGMQVKKAADPGESPVNNIAKAADNLKELESKVNQLTGMLQKLMEQMQSASQQQQKPEAQNSQQMSGDELAKVGGAGGKGGKVSGAEQGNEIAPEKPATQEMSKQMDNLFNQMRNMMEKLQQEEKVNQNKSVEFAQKAQEAATKVQPSQQSGSTGMGMAMSTFTR